MLQLTKTVSVLLSAFLLACAVQGSDTTTSSTPNPVPKFSCGRDLCEITVQYCDPEGSSDPADWTCHQCSEIPDRWCAEDLTKVPRDCYGYCQALKHRAEMTEVEARNRQEWEKRIANPVKSSEAKVDDLKHQLGVTKSEHAELAKIAVIPKGGLDNFLIKNRCFIGMFSLLELGVIVFVLVYRCVCPRTPRRRWPRLPGWCNSGGEDVEMDLISDRDIDKSNKPVVQEARRPFKDEGTQTDHTALLGPTFPVVSDGHLIPENRVEFTQPADKGSHGVRVLPKSTVTVNPNGVDIVEDNGFLNVQN